MRIGVYAGSFDPFTNGHLHVVKEAAEVFDKVIIGMAVNPDKTKRINETLMQKAIIETLAEENLTNVEVVSFKGLTAFFAAENGAKYLIRGLRNGTDYEYEENLANINFELNGSKTIYFRAGKTSHISSSMVMAILKSGGNIDKWVPKPILDLLKE